MGNKKPAGEPQGALQRLNAKIQDWREQRRKQKELDDLYARLDRNAAGKFDYTAHIRMLAQMKKRRK